MPSALNDAVPPAPEDTQMGCPPSKTAEALPESDEARNALVARLAKALAHPTRVAIVRQLSRIDTCVSDLVGELPFAQSTVSQHLKILKDAGLIRGVIDGPKVSYCLEPSVLSTLRALLEEF